MRRLTEIKSRHDASPNGNSDANKDLQEPLDAHSAFPYLEKISMTAKKNPYAMLTIIISIASVIVIAVTTLSVSILGSVFVMYGKMSAMENQQQVIIEKLTTNDSELKVLRTYESSVLASQNYAVGLMDSRQQERMNSYDKANPIPKLPKE